MGGSRVIDVHAHASETKTLGAWSTKGYEVWEYGVFEGVRFGSFDGDLSDLDAAMAAGGIDHAIVVNSFTIDEWRSRWIDGPLATGAEDAGLVHLAEEPLSEQLFAFNAWLVDGVRDRAHVSAFVSVDPWVANLDVTGTHLIEMCAAGARGVKIHPIEQRFPVTYPGAIQLVQLCADLGLPVITHSGPSRDPSGFAEPLDLSLLLRAVPSLRLIVAHLGGAAWRQLPAFVDEHPNAAFDCSEIVSWLGAPGAPSVDEFVTLVHRVGVERVMFGSDFPWYDPGPVTDIIRGLPGFTDAERAAILGENAARILELPL